MGRKKNAEDVLASGAKLAGATPIERLVRKMKDTLPLLDRKTLDAALEEVKEHPGTSLHYLFENFGASDPGIRAVVAYVVARCGGAEMVDNLNGILFDADQDPSVKAQANELLAKLGSPVDPDVFAMSVPNAEEIEQALPSRTLKLLAAGDVEGAAAHARGLTPPERFLVIYDAVRGLKDRAVPLLEALARGGTDDATAVIGAVAAESLGAGAPLLRELAASGNRTLQKMVKRTLFEMRKAGIETPEEKAEPEAPSVGKGRGGDLPLSRALLGEPSPNGPIVAIIAWERPDGRLRVFTVLIDPWKRGIERAVLRNDMSKSSFRRFVSAHADAHMKLKDVTFDECRRMIARGVRVTREFGTPLPLDFGMGKPLLGDIDADAAQIEHPFRCSKCDGPLDEASVRKIRDAAGYDNIPVETRCERCRSDANDT